MKFSRINLSNTNYQIISNYVIFDTPPIEKLQQIYQQYCAYKKFESVMPLFDTQFTDPNTDVFGYFDINQDIVAFSMVKRHDCFNAESLQFAWDYNDPKLRLGIVSLENECAYYKKHGFSYLYLGPADKYKQKLDGFEIL